MRFICLLLCVAACRVQGALPSTKVEGTACSAPDLGQATVELTGLDEGLTDVEVARFGELGDPETDPEIAFAEDVTVVTGCARTFSRPYFSIKIPREQIHIGKHDIKQSGASALLRAGISDGIAATGGFVTLTGYDPTTDSLCGSAEVVFPDRTVKTTFSAKAFCD